MFNLDQIVVTEISEPITVLSAKGKRFEQESRRKCGLSFCLGGTIQYVSKGKIIVSDENNIVFLPKGAKYTLFGTADGRFPLINFECLGDVGDEVLSFSLHDKAACIRLYEKIKDLFLLGGSKHEIYASFYQLLVARYLMIASPTSLVFAVPPRSGVRVLPSTIRVSMALIRRVPQAS